MKAKSVLPRYPNKGLTDLQVKHMKPEPNRRLEIPAGPPVGLYLVVQKSGAKSWALRYRWRGRTRKATLTKPYPDLTLQQARAEATAKLDALRDDDIDPAAALAEQAAEENPETVGAIIEEWFKRHIRKNCEWPEAERLMKANALPVWRDKYIHELARPDVLRLIDSVVDRGSPVAANRLLAVVRAWFNWCVDRGYIATSPAAGINLPTVETSRDRVLSPNELTEIWTATESLGYPFGPFTRFLALVAQRRGEVAEMRWKDIDLDKGMWTLPKEATKAGRVHDVPLSSAALEILTAKNEKGDFKVPRFTKGDYIWTTMSGEKSINGFSKMKTRIDAATMKQRKAAAEKAGLDLEKVKNIADWTLHDLRRTAATLMAKANVPPHVLSAILNHAPGSTQGVTSIYNRFRYTEERRAALQAWADFVVGLVTNDGKKAAAR